MRLITVRTPTGEGRIVAKLAFDKGVAEVSIMPANVLNNRGGSSQHDVVHSETATPNAKEFIEELMQSPFYDPSAYSFAIRHPESIFGSKEPKEEIQPIIRPTTDVYEELYQFTKVTGSLAARVFLSSILLAYGMVENFLPLMIAGLLFLPFHHHMLGISLGFRLKEWTFLKQAALAFLSSTLLIFLAGVCVAFTTTAPIQFEISGSVLSGAILAGVIGLAAALGSVDDAGRRELIGLAATAHISVYPAWFGLQAVFQNSTQHKTEEYFISFFTNIVALIFVAFLTYVAVKMNGEGIRRFITTLRPSVK